MNGVRNAKRIMIAVLMIGIFAAAPCFGQDIPALDTTGRMIEICRYAAEGSDVYYLMGKWLQDKSFSGVEFSAYFRAELYQNDDRENCLASAQIFLRNVVLVSRPPDQYPSFEEEWATFIQTLAQRIRDADIEVSAAVTITPFAQRVWDRAFDGSMSLGESGGKLRLITDGAGP